MMVRDCRTMMVRDCRTMMVRDCRTMMVRDCRTMMVRDCRTMMVPTNPAPHLVMIKTDFTFGFFKDRFDGPSHPADPHEFVQRRIERRIAEKVFDLSRVI